MNKTIPPNTLGKVRQAIDLAQLKKRCTQPTGQLMAGLGGSIEGPEGQKYAYRNTGSRILAVAHCDSVLEQNHFELCRLTDRTMLFNTRLDDRLGAYTILDLLPRLQIHLDILLTDNEEAGSSTARHFKTTKAYNWLVQFDRRGEDAVTYDYLSWSNVIRQHFETGFGSYTCIRDLEHLGACGVNIAIGYHGEHTPMCYVDLDEYTRQIARFVAFYHRHKRTRFPHKRAERRCAPTGQPYLWDYRETSYLPEPHHAAPLTRTSNTPKRADYWQQCEICGLWATNPKSVQKFGEEYICRWCLARYGTSGKTAKATTYE